MDYKEKVIAFLNSKELSKEQKEKLEGIFPELKESEDKRIRKWIIGVLSTYEHDRDLRNAAIAWLEKQGEHSHVWSEEDEKMYQSIMDDTVQENQLSSNQTNWLRDIKYRYFPQLKQKWSEDDEYYYGIIQYFLNDECVGKTDKENANYWLKSLKNRYTWKPSDEQMLAINTAINVLGKGTLDGRQLIELREELQRLREDKL